VRSKTGLTIHNLSAESRRGTSTSRSSGQTRSLDRGKEIDAGDQVARRAHSKLESTQKTRRLNETARIGFRKRGLHMFGGSGDCAGLEGQSSTGFDPRPSTKTTRPPIDQSMPSKGLNAKDISENSVPDKPHARPRQLPNRRACETSSFEHCGPRPSR